MVTLAPSQRELEPPPPPCHNRLCPMTLLASITMPPFTDDEVAVLRHIEGVLGRHPYMRADLGGTGPIARALEDVLSTRLALLHTEASARTGGESAALLGKLRAWEAQLADALIDEEGSDELRAAFERDHADKVEELVAAEHKRRERKRKKEAKASSDGPLSEWGDQQPAEGAGA